MKMRVPEPQSAPGVDSDKTGLVSIAVSEQNASARSVAGRRGVWSRAGNAVAVEPQGLPDLAHRGHWRAGGRRVFAVLNVIRVSVQRIQRARICGRLEI